MRYIQASPEGRGQPPTDRDCEPVERMLSVIYITKPGVGSLFMRMFWEDEKRCAPGPTDNIHKMPPRGPADHNRHVPSPGRHW
jgi:hypothetical protein